MTGEEKPTFTCHRDGDRGTKPQSPELGDRVINDSSVSHLMAHFLTPNCLGMSSLPMWLSFTLKNGPQCLEKPKDTPDI